tara:strand:- start:561 stop:998 length:438 start_codon:yes stop_codon:yes gene_type:complete
MSYFQKNKDICFLKNCIVKTDLIPLSACKKLWIGKNRDIRENPDGPMIGLLPSDCNFIPGWQSTVKKDTIDTIDTINTIDTKNINAECLSLSRRILDLDYHSQKLIKNMIIHFEKSKKELENIQKKTKEAKENLKELKKTRELYI